MLRDISFILAPFPIDSLPYIDSVLMNNHGEDVYLSEIETSPQNMEPNSDRVPTEGSKFQFSFA